MFPLLIDKPMPNLSELSTDSRYTIKTVTTQTGIRAVTIRAWENRYNLLSPLRSNNRYRLYSDRDVATLRWVKSQVDQGMAISAVVRDLNNMLNRGEYPEVLPAITPRNRSYVPVPPETMASQLHQALIANDENAAGEVLKQASAMYDLTTVCMEVIGGALVTIGEAWHRGDIRGTTQHNASRLLQARLVTLLQAFPSRRAAPLILTACAPDEMHESALLMLSVLLSHDGYRVEYLGTDLALDDIVDYSRQEKPAMVCMSATTEESALALARMNEKLAKIKPRVLFGYGGLIFNLKPALREKVSGEYLGDSIIAGAARVNQLLG